MSMPLWTDTLIGSLRLSPEVHKECLGPVEMAVSCEVGVIVDILAVADIDSQGIVELVTNELS